MGRPFGSQQFMTNGPAPILLIDDDEFIAGSLRDYLRAQGVCVDVALELAAAETLMRGRRYGIIVVDPYLTGGVQRENAKLLRTIRGLQPGVPIMIVTGYGSAAMSFPSGRESTLVGPSDHRPERSNRNGAGATRG